LGKLAGQLGGLRRTGVQAVRWDVAAVPRQQHDGRRGQQARGREDGHELDDWLRAEEEVTKKNALPIAA